MRQYLSKIEIEAMQYIHSGDYRRVGTANSSLDDQVSKLKDKGLLTVQYGPSDCSRTVLTRSGMCVLAGLS